MTVAMAGATAVEVVVVVSRTRATTASTTAVGFRTRRFAMPLQSKALGLTFSSKSDIS